MNYNTLLSRCEAIVDEYQSLEKSSGKGYNLFSVLGVYDEEVLHSKVIASLLDINGKHRQGNIFLKEFINVCYGQDCYDFDIESYSIVCEKAIGSVKIDEEYSDGGRIDIFISDKYGHHIIVENKIYAGDQEQQLERYNKHRGIGTPPAPILYLSPFGKKPSKNSYGKLKEDDDYKCISYKEHIHNWLTKCTKLDIPDYLKHSIENYINLVDRITKQSYLNNMSEDIIKAINENIDAAIEISKAMDDARAEAVYQLFSNLYDSIIMLKRDGFPEPVFSIGYSEDNNGLNSDIFREKIKEYVKSTSKEENRYFGVGMSLGKVDDCELYLRITVNYNIFYDLYCCSEIGSATNDLIKKLGICIDNKDNVWSSLDQNAKYKKYRIAWRYPINNDTKYAMYQFGTYLKKYLKADDIGKKFIADNLAKDFLDQYVDLVEAVKAL